MPAANPAPRKTVIAAVHPLASGAAHFNGAMVSAMARSGAVDVISWRRMYPPLVYRGQRTDTSAADSSGPGERGREASSRELGPFMRFTG